MNFYLRKNGSVIGPISQTDFLARIASGEYSATDEMSTDGIVWTRLGLTGYARSIQTSRFVAQPRLGSVVGNLSAAPQFPAATPPGTSESLKQPIPQPGVVNASQVKSGSSAAKKAVPVLVLLLLAAIGALALLLLRPAENPEGNSAAIAAAEEESAEPVAFEATTADLPAALAPAPDAARVAALEEMAADLARVRSASAVATSESHSSSFDFPASGQLPSEWALRAVESGRLDSKAVVEGGKTVEQILGGGDAAPPAKKAVSLKDPLVMRAIMLYVRPSANSQELLLDTIKKSDHVAQKFADIASRTRFFYFPEDDTVNADSSYGVETNTVAKTGSPSAVETNVVQFGRVRLYGGLVRVARALGAVMAFGGLEGDEETLDFLYGLGKTMAETGGDFSENALLAALDGGKCDPEGFVSSVRRSEAETIANGVVLSVMAHEFGHLAKGHLNGGDANHMISQLEEQEADLFASMIAASVPNGPQVFVGQVLSMLVFSFAESALPDPGADAPRRLSTHPASRERVLNAIRANREYAAAAGLSEDSVREYFKAIDEKKGRRENQVP